MELKVEAWKDTKNICHFCLDESDVIEAVTLFLIANRDIDTHHIWDINIGSVTMG